MNEIDRLLVAGIKVALYQVMSHVIKGLMVCHGSKLLFGKNAGKSRVVGV